MGAGLVVGGLSKLEFVGEGYGSSLRGCRGGRWSIEVYSLYPGSSVLCPRAFADLKYGPSEKLPV